MVVGTGITKLDLWTPLGQGLYQWFIIENPYVTMIIAGFLTAAGLVAVKLRGGEH